MSPLSFDPIAPWLSLALALSATPIALALHRRRRAEAPSQPAPTRRQIAATAISCVAGLVMVLISGLVLERCAAETLMRTSHGVGMGEPMSWLGAAAAALCGGARLAWQAVMLVGPLLFALDTLADRRPPARLIHAAVALMISPLFTALIVLTVPLDRAPTTLVAALLLWAAVLGIALMTRRPKSPTRVDPAPAPRPTIAMQVVRQPTPPPTDETEISLLPAALARQVNDPRPAPALPKLAPPIPPLKLPPAAVRRARRLQKTLAEVPRRPVAY